MATEKQVYTAPQLKKIYVTPQLTEHGSVAELTGSALPPNMINGNQQVPPALMAKAIPGKEPEEEPPKEKTIGQVQEPPQEPLQELPESSQEPSGAARATTVRGVDPASRRSGLARAAVRGAGTA